MSRPAHIAVAVVAMMICATLAHAIEIDATWQVGSANWSTDTNWDCICIPCNDKFVEYNVIIPSGTGVVTFDVPNCQIKRLTLGAGRTLRLLPGSSLTVLEDAAIGGTIDADGGNLTAIHPTLVSFSGNQSRVLANDGSVVRIAADTYSSAGMWSLNSTIMSADGVGTLLDLSSVTSLSTAFNDGSNTVRAHTITATAGGTIDLSGLLSMFPPAQSTDFANFSLGDPDSLIDLTSLQTISGSGGYTRFVLSGGAVQTLPAIETLSNVDFDLSGEAQMLVNGPLPAAYSSAGMWSFNSTIMSADGVDTVLDLSSVTSLSTAFNDGSNTVRSHTITATAGGTIDLSGLLSMSPPAQSTDFASINLGDPDSLIDLTSLQTISGSGGYTRFVLSGSAVQTLPAIETLSDVQFSLSSEAQMLVNGPLPAAYSSSGMWSFNSTIMSADGLGTLLDLSSVTSLSTAFNDGSNTVRAHTITATAGGTIDLSGLLSMSPPAQSTDFASINLGDPDSLIDLTSLQTISGSGGYTRFVLSGSAVQTLPAIETLSDVQFSLSSEAQMLANGPLPATYSSAGMWSFNSTIMLADGLGTLLDLSSVTSLSTAFNDGSNTIRGHTITATAGGTIDLSSVVSMSPPAQSTDFASLVVSGTQALLDLSALNEVSGGGDVFVNVTDAILRIGELCGATADVDINLNDMAARLEAPGSLKLNARVDLIAAVGAQVAVAGRLCFTHPVENDLDLSAAIVELNGAGTAQEPQWIEVGGVDFDLACGLGGTNFSIGELVIGQAGQPTVVALREDIDNENRLSNPEALYLRGLVNKVSTLQILGGSTFVINDINAYICDEVVRVKDLFPPDVSVIPYDQGFIELGNFPVTGDIDGDGIVGIVDFLTLLASWGPCPDPVLYCPADIDCDCIVGITDFLLLLELWTV